MSPFQEFFPAVHIVLHIASTTARVNRFTNFVGSSGLQFKQAPGFVGPHINSKKVNERHKQRKKSKHYKEARGKKRRALYKLYEQQKERVKYVKNMLLPVQAEKFRCDHNYTKNDKPKRVKDKKNKPLLILNNMVDAI